MPRAPPSLRPSPLAHPRGSPATHTRGPVSNLPAGQALLALASCPARGVDSGNRRVGTGQSRQRGPASRGRQDSFPPSLWGWLAEARAGFWAPEL